MSMPVSFEWPQRQCSLIIEQPPSACINTTPVELQWLEPWWLIYPAWLELVLWSLWSHKWDLYVFLATAYNLSFWGKIEVFKSMKVIVYTDYW